MRPYHPMALLVLAGCGARWELIDSGTATSAAPEVTLSDPAPASTWSVTAAIPVRAVITDDQDEASALVVEIRSDRLGLVARPTLSADGVLDTTITLPDAGTHVLTVVAIDTEANAGEDTTTVAVFDVADPGVVTVLPEAPVTGDTLTCAHDPLLDQDGAPLPSSYAWTIDGVAVEGATTDTLEGSYVRRDGAVHCTLRLEDGTGTSWDAEAVVIGNALPTTEPPIVSPDVADETSVLTCLPGAALDLEGDELVLSKRWLVGGVDVGSTETLDGAAFSRGDEVVCEVTPADPFGAGTPATSAPVVIGNIAPGAPTVAFTAAAITPGTPATCVVETEAFDPDGDAITYTWSWTVNGAARPEADATLDTTGLSGGDELTCTATPDDGVSLGAPGSATLVLIAPTTGDVGASDASLVIAGTSGSGAFGKAVDTVSDLDGDGLPELLVSAPRGNGSAKGAVYLFTSTTLAAGADLLDTDADAWWVGHAAEDNLGGARGAAGIGDFDGDGLGDLAAAAILNDEGGGAAGAAYVLYGGDAWTAGADIQADAPARILGNADDWIGVRMAGGDLDGDGLDDLAVSAPYNDLAISRGGAVAVFHGDAARYAGTYGIADADAIVTGVRAADDLGWSLDVGGDADADGYTDLLVGTFHAWGGVGYTGAAAVVSGDDLTGTRTFLDAGYLVVHGAGGGGERFGYDVASLGDVDGDGVSDLLFGGYLADGAGADAGEARLFYGAAGTSRTAAADEADASFFGGSAGEQLGSTLTAAGDFDADGLADFLIGAPRASASGAASGTAHLYLGRDAGTWGAAGASAALRVSGDAAGDWLSDELAGGLDVNGDGFSDLALGAQGADVAAAGGGAVYVFTGP